MRSFSHVSNLQAVSIVSCDLLRSDLLLLAFATSSSSVSISPFISVAKSSGSFCHEVLSSWKRALEKDRRSAEPRS